MAEIWLFKATTEHSFASFDKTEVKYFSIEPAFGSGEMLQTTVVYRCTLCNNDRKQYSNEISLLEHQCTECELNNMRLLDLFADVRQLTRRTIVQIPVTETNGLQFLPAQSLKLRMVTDKPIGMQQRVYLLRNMHDNGTRKVYNTCSFNSIAHIFAALYADYDPIRTEFANRSNGFITFFKTIAAWDNNQNPNDVYGMRTDLLFALFAQSNQVKSEINCELTIVGMYERLSGDQIYSYEYINQCQKLKALELPSKTFRFIDIDLRRLNDENFSCFDRFLNIGSKRNSQCECGGDRVQAISLSNLVAFDVQLFTEGFVRRSIGEIPSDISIYRRSFELVAFIQFDIPRSHFIAHIKRSNQIWECFDDTAERVVHSNMNEQFTLALIFYMKSSNKNVKK